MCLMKYLNVSATVAAFLQIQPVFMISVILRRTLLQNNTLSCSLIITLEPRQIGTFPPYIAATCRQTPINRQTLPSANRRREGKNTIFSDKKTRAFNLLKTLIEWRRARDSNPRSRFSDLHDFQSCVLI